MFITVTENNNKIKQMYLVLSPLFFKSRNNQYCYFYKNNSKQLHIILLSVDYNILLSHWFIDKDINKYASRWFVLSDNIR